METPQVLELVGGILVLCWAIKQAGLNTRFIPILAMILGIAGAMYLGGVNLLSTTSGVLMGLATTLGYREVKSSFE